MVSTTTPFSGALNVVVVVDVVVATTVITVLVVAVIVHMVLTPLRWLGKDYLGCHSYGIL